MTTQLRVRILRAMLKTRPRFERLARHLLCCSIVFGAAVTAHASPGDHVDSPVAPPAAAASAAAPVAAAANLVAQVRDRASDMVITAMNFLGVRYQRGGNDADVGFDCSGFTRQVFETSLGLVLPRRADEQARADGLVKVRKDELQPGDLVFFNTLRRTFSHVGIYVGDGKFIHSPRTGSEVRIEDMRQSYWQRRFDGARRVTAEAKAQP